MTKNRNKPAALLNIKTAQVESQQAIKRFYFLGNVMVEIPPYLWYFVKKGFYENAIKGLSVGQACIDAILIGKMA